MCQFQNQRQSFNAEPIPAPPLEGARALYPLLDTGEPPSPAPLPTGLFPSTGIEIAQALPKTDTPIGPTYARTAGLGEDPSPTAAPDPVERRPKVVEANVGKALFEIAKRAGALLRREEPAPVPAPPPPVLDPGRKKDARRSRRPTRATCRPVRRRRRLPHPSRRACHPRRTGRRSSRRTKHSCRPTSRAS